MKAHSTEQAAKQAGITRVTLQRWLSKALIRPSIAIPMRGQTLWRWTAADIRRVKQLRGKFRPGPKPKVNIKKLRAIISGSNWRTATSAKYKTCPHSYLNFFDSKTKWLWFSRQIKRFGTYKIWKGHKYKYLTVGDEVFWTDWPALNRAKADTLD